MYEEVSNKPISLNLETIAEDFRQTINSLVVEDVATYIVSLEEQSILQNVINMKDHLGNTALHYVTAQMQQNKGQQELVEAGFEIFQLIIEKGGDL